MNKERLEKLIVALEGVHPDQFYMGRYIYDCGTPACVLGHYASRRDLQKSFRLDHDLGCPVTNRGRDAGSYDESVHEHFGISDAQSERLFAVNGCDGAQTPKQAQRYIRKFIDSNGEVR